MPRAAVNHLIEIQKQKDDGSGYEPLATVYCRRVDRSVNLKDENGVDVNTIFTDYIVAPRIIKRIDPEGLIPSSSGSEAFGRTRFGADTFGGRGMIQGELFTSTGVDLKSEYFVEDKQRKTTSAIVGIIEYEKGDRAIRTVKVS